MKKKTSPKKSRSFDLRRDAEERGVLLVAHRGVWGGNVPCNTLAAYDIALAHGADMLEIDVDMTADGKLVIFHPGMERAMLGWNGRLGQVPWSFASKLRYMNVDEAPTQFGLCTLDEVLRRYNGRCYLNVDKFWDHPAEIAAAIREHGMQDQCLVKTGPDARVLSILEEHASDMPFLAVVRDEDSLHAVRRRRLRHVGAEVLFSREDHPFASEEFIEREHRAGRLLWANAIVYDCRVQLVAGRSDDRATAGGDPEGSWGWLADRGYDFIQTDWMLACSQFLAATGRRR